MRDLTYAEVKKWLISHEEGRLISTVSDGLGLLAILTVVGLGATPALIGLTADLLAIKTEVTNLATKVLAWFGKDKQPSPSDRIQRMRVAYGLITCSAFFEAVERRMPDAMRAFRIDQKDRARLVASSLGQLKGKQEIDTNEFGGDPWEKPLLPFPHPADDWDQQQRELSQVYGALSIGLASFLPCLAHWDEMSERSRQDLLDECANIPREALSCFESQYTVLASECHEFEIWAHRQEYISGQRRFDYGMRHLEKAISSLYGLISNRDSEDFSGVLRNWYITQVTKPILREREIADDLPPGVTLPRKMDAFVPQYFKVIRYEIGTPISSEDLWSRLSVRDDLPDFLWSYIHSPHSVHHPLIILGHPGSGKSLLTEIFAARLAASPFIPIRILLRDISADARISQQIDEQLATDVGGSANWSRLRMSLVANPAVLIFDGYDELLQASGQVFANYIMDAQQFQFDEEDRSRSGVRVIITSRATLIEKARIPKGATILRLLPFDENQRSRWIDAWNAANSSGLQEQGLEPFRMPANNAVLDLSEQPLLLLMLAIYDSHGNALRQLRDFSRVSLYSELISLFIRRECNKDQTFRDLSDDQQDSIVARQRRRLGICALGMFSREKLSLTLEELEEDLVQFGLSPEKLSDGHQLTEADALIGGFFFIHRSRVKEHDGSNTKARMSYEFLHNTFGEYLCAEFLLNRLLDLMSDLMAMKTNQSLASYRQRLLDDPSLLAGDWYGCWMVTPLSTRPVIVEMIHEMVIASDGTYIRGSSFSEKLSELTTLIHNHFRCFFAGHAIPAAMLDAQSSAGRLSVVSRIAVYSLNLVIACCALHKKGYDIAFSQLAKYLGNEDPWDRIVNLWLAALPDGSKWSISGLLEIRSTEEGLHLSLRQPFDATIASNPAQAFTALGLLISRDLRKQTEQTSQLTYALLRHELTNRIHNLEYFLKDLAGPAKPRTEPKLQRVNAEFRRVTEFINDWFAIQASFSGSELQKEHPKIPVERLFNDLIEMFNGRSRETGVRLEVSYPRDVVILLEGKLLLHALANVVDNAFHASSRGGIISLEAHSEAGERIVILVRDQGIGMDESQLSRLLEAGLSSRGGRSGFGLYITKTFIDHLGGALDFTSRFNEGTTVRISLPINADQAQRSSDD